MNNGWFPTGIVSINENEEILIYDKRSGYDFVYIERNADSDIFSCEDNGKNVDCRLLSYWLPLTEPTNDTP